MYHLFLEATQHKESLVFFLERTIAQINPPCFDVPRPSIFAASAAKPQNREMDQTRRHPKPKHDVLSPIGLMDDCPSG